MKVLVAADRMGPLTSAEAGACLGEGWSGHNVAVVPIGEAGGGWLRALADQVGSDVRLVATGSDAWVGETTVEVAGTGDSPTGRTLGVAVEPAEAMLADTLDLERSSAPLGTALLAALDGCAQDGDAGSGPTQVAVDLAQVGAHDAGAGFLSALGIEADADLAGGVSAWGSTLSGINLSTISWAAVRNRFAGLDLVGVVPHDQLRNHLLGLRGITSIAGRAGGMDTHQMLAVDAAIERFVGMIAPEPAAEPGAGACGGLGWAILALGGRLVSGTEHLGERVGLAHLAGVADLVVTGCDQYDFATRGGGAVATIAAAAEQAMRPCITVAGEVLIGSREMRTMGIEAAYPAPGLAGPDPREALTEASHRVARSWTW